MRLEERTELGSRTELEIWTELGIWTENWCVTLYSRLGCDSSLKTEV